MSQINSNTKDDFQVVLQLSCFVGHPVSKGSQKTEAEVKEKFKLTFAVKKLRFSRVSEVHFTNWAKPCGGNKTFKPLYVTWFKPRL